MQNKKDKYIFWSMILVIIVVVVMGSFFIVRGLTPPPNASILNQSLNLKGGATINSHRSDNALLVLSGNTGLGGVINPSEKLDVQGNIKLGWNGNTILADDTISHYETSLTNTTNTYIANGVCGCQDIIIYNSSGNNNKNLASLLVDGVENIFTVPEANAKRACYTQSECISTGCNYCQDEGVTCNPGEYACSISCDVGATTANAQCDTGDTVVLGTSQTGKCYGTSYVYQVQCSHTTTSGQSGDFNKIEFRGSPSTGKPPEIELYTNIIANDNVRDACAWETGNKCGNNKFIAGYDNSNDQIYCCDL